MYFYTSNLESMKKILGLLMIVLLSSGTPKPTKTMKIYYVYDALCGWCYGFSPVMTAFADKHQKEVKVEVITGGMVTGDRIGPIGEVAGYIGEAYKQVENYTGVKFGQPFLKGVLQEGSATFTSIPSSIALMIFKEQAPQDQVAFAAQLLKAVYYDGMKPEDSAAYGKLAADFGLDSTNFTAKMSEPKYLKAARKEFALANSMGVNGFPTLILEYNDERVVMARGYTPINQLEQQFLAAKKQLGIQ